MSIRQSYSDWQFGYSKSNYLVEVEEIALNIKTRVMSFLNDCFFDMNQGIDYFNLLEYGKEEVLENKIQEVIIQTSGVTAVNLIDLMLTADRKFVLQYSINTIYAENYQGKLELNPVI